MPRWVANHLHSHRASSYSNMLLILCSARGSPKTATTHWTCNYMYTHCWRSIPTFTLYIHQAHTVLLQLKYCIIYCTSCIVSATFIFFSSILPNYIKFLKIYCLCKTNNNVCSKTNNNYWFYYYRLHNK